MYHFNYDPFFLEFLRVNRIKHSTSDADIISFELEGYNDTPLFELMMEFCEWRKDNENDMTLNRNGNGSKYHARG